MESLVEIRQKLKMSTFHLYLCVSSGLKYILQAEISMKVFYELLVFKDKYMCI